MPDPSTSQPEINLEDYTYDLPEDRIAKFPLEKRDQARLLVYRKGNITHHQFGQLSEFIPATTLLVFNNTRVIPARLHFQKPDLNGIPGAVIEVFLLEPEAPSRVLAEAMKATGNCTWQCLIGNKKRWKRGDQLVQTLLLDKTTLRLSAELLDPETNLVRFTWNNDRIPFADIVRQLGELPLPPYLKRKATMEDEEQYQTVYSEKEGAVAAPTAGLHFTPQVLQELADKGIATDFLTLHVGAGTFQPIKGNDVWQHPMHAEQIIFTEANLRALLSHLSAVFAVGTTSLRALESLYWYGVKLLKQRPQASSASSLKEQPAVSSGSISAEEMIEFRIEKLLPYQWKSDNLPPAAEAIGAVLALMQEEGRREIVGETEILIVPGYEFKIVKGLVTNYHLPGTTLMLLVAAFVGNDWRKVYQEALANDYRFLSYGDSSLLIP